MAVSVLLLVDQRIEKLRAKIKDLEVELKELERARRALKKYLTPEPTLPEPVSSVTLETDYPKEA